MTITKIENITYNEAVEIAMETINIKGHECVFVNLGESFGYSVLVFKDGRHVYYANDYELHHKYIMREQGAEALRKWYIDALNNKLFTDAELMKEVKTYDEYNRKQYFLRNYWIMRHEYNTAFYIGNEQKREIEEAKKKLPFYNPVSFCYVADKEIITKQTEILEH